MGEFVLDENVIIRASLAEATQEPSDFQAADLVACLQERHEWVFSDEMIPRYYQKISSRQGGRSVLATRIFASLTNVLNDSIRHRLVGDAPRVPGGYDPNDAHVVAAAAASRSVLITMDEKLAAALESEGIPKSNGFIVLSVPEALLTMCCGQHATFP